MYGGKNLLNANKEYSETSKLIRQLQSNSPSLKNGEEKKKLSLLGKNNLNVQYGRCTSVGDECCLGGVL